VNDATGWARLPRWQHLTLIVLCCVGALAAVANVVAADRLGNRLLHGAIAVITVVLLVTLISAYRRRRQPEAE
jgi:predicted lysophospholipase L1 biosynthesis ABC-type transport system permease subunit